MNLQVNDDAMKALVAKAIVDSLSPEMRQQLITDAVTKSLTTPADGGGYGSRKRSPLQEAFDGAVYNEAQRYAKQMLETDEKFQAELQKLFAEVAAKLFATEGSDRDELVHAIASTIRNALTKDRY